MDEFTIIQLNNDSYDIFLLCLTFESIATYKQSIESSNYIRGKTGKILIDQLLVTGNGPNRFICCNYFNGFLDFTSARVVPANYYYKSITVEWLHRHNEYIEYSILTAKQRQYIRDSIPF